MVLVKLELEVEDSSTTIVNVWVTESMTFATIVELTFAFSSSSVSPNGALVGSQSTPVLFIVLVVLLADKVLAVVNVDVLFVDNSFTSYISCSTSM